MIQLACLFLGHLFNAAEWALMSEVKRYVDYSDGEGKRPQGTERVYKNTCLRCGDLMFRRVRSME